VDSFEEAIRDHLRLRGAGFLSDEQLTELLASALPDSEAPNSFPPGIPDAGVAPCDGDLDTSAPLAARVRTLVERRAGALAETVRHLVVAVRPLAFRLSLGFVALATAALVVPAAVATVRSDRIADGVRVGGVPLGGLSAQSARRALEHRFAAAKRHPVVFRFGNRSWRLAPAASHITIDASAGVRAALAASRRDSFPKRLVNAIARRRRAVDLRAPVSFSAAAVARLTSRVSRTVEREPRDATVRPAGSRLHRVPDRPGVVVERAKLARLVSSRLASAVGPRELTVPTRRISAGVSTAELPRRYRNYVVIRRSQFRLEYFHELRRVRSYPIAVGKQGLETPAGVYEIQGKQVNPSWQVPNASWAGSKAGKLIPPGPANPIKARWMGFNGSAGIHGTAELGSLGTAASHGCVRMSLSDVKDLYRRVRVRTPVRVE